MQLKKRFENYVSFKTQSVETIFNFILDEYKIASNKTKKPCHTNFLLTTLQKVLKWVKFSDIQRQKLKRKIDRSIMSFRILSNQRTKPARTYPPIELLELIQTQWNRPVLGSGAKALVRKYSAAMAMICFLTGRRWVDVTRIRWDNHESFTTQLGIFYKFYIPTSKTNIRGTRIECITLKNVVSDKYIGPIKMLNLIRIWQGNPKKGFVFPCVHKARCFQIDKIWTPWSSYRCQGHWENKDKVECLGQINGNVTIGSLQRLAKKLGWPTVPTKHTFRRLVTLLHKRQGYSNAQINEMMGWVPTSNMPVHYAAQQESLMKSAPANMYALELGKDHPFDQFNDLQFTL